MGSPGGLVREARRRAGLSQEELGSRAGTTQSAVARLESGRSAPGFSRVADLISACGLELRVAIREPIPVSPPTQLTPATPLLRALIGRGVRFLVVGEPAAALHGGSVGARVPAVCPDDARDNLLVLCDLLDEVAARVRTPDGTGTLPLDRTPGSLLGRSHWPLATTEGDLDVVLRPAGTAGYSDLVRGATTVAGDGLELPTASLPDVIRELEAASADPDLVHALRRLAEVSELGAG